MSTISSLPTSQSFPISTQDYCIPVNSDDPRLRIVSSEMHVRYAQRLLRTFGDQPFMLSTTGPISRKVADLSTTSQEILKQKAYPRDSIQAELNIDKISKIYQKKFGAENVQEKDLSSFAQGKIFTIKQRQATATTPSLAENNPAYATVIDEMHAIFAENLIRILNLRLNPLPTRGSIENRVTDLSSSSQQILLENAYDRDTVTTNMNFDKVRQIFCSALKDNAYLASSLISSSL